MTFGNILLSLQLQEECMSRVSYAEILLLGNFCLWRPGITTTVHHGRKAMNIYFTDSLNNIGSVDEEDAEKGQHIDTNEACGDDNEEDKSQPGIS